MKRLPIKLIHNLSKPLILNLFNTLSHKCISSLQVHHTQLLLIHTHRHRHSLPHKQIHTNHNHNNSMKPHIHKNTMHKKWISHPLLQLVFLQQIQSMNKLRLLILNHNILKPQQHLPHPQQSLLFNPIMLFLLLYKCLPLLIMEIKIRFPLNQLILLINNHKTIK